MSDMFDKNGVYIGDDDESGEQAFLDAAAKTDEQFWDSVIEW